MKSFRTLERRIEKEIMNTDVMIRIASAEATKEEMVHTIENAFRIMRQFADRYSRFIEGNLLWQFNQSTGGVVSEELFDLLSRAKRHYQATDGRFDPGILPALEREGYGRTYGAASDSTQPVSFEALRLNATSRTAEKPLELKIDFGGFGKGYIVDRIATHLSETYPHVLVDAGGDIAACGGDIGRGETSWIIGVENPVQRDIDICLLSLSDQAVATSGRNRRAWQSGKTIKHHLINPKTGRSSESSLLSVTAIASSAEEADVLAKTLFLRGEGAAQEFASEQGIPAIFCSGSGAFEINHFAQPYVCSAA